MPIDPTDPTFRGLLAAARGGGPCRRCKGKAVWALPTVGVCPRCGGTGREDPDPAAARALADWLPEQGATAADVLRLFAAPPAAELGLAREAVFGPFRLTGATVRVGPPPDDDDSLLPVLAAWAEGHAPPGRAAAARGLRVERHSPNSWCLVGPGDGHHAYTAEPAARRARKRAALGLWDGEVEVPCPACGGGGWARGPERGHVCGPCGGLGRVKPGDLIPPEPGGAVWDTRSFRGS